MFLIYKAVSIQSILVLWHPSMCMFLANSSQIKSPQILLVECNKPKLCWKCSQPWKERSHVPSLNAKALLRCSQLSGESMKLCHAPCHQVLNPVQGVLPANKSFNFHSLISVHVNEMHILPASDTPPVLNVGNNFPTNSSAGTSQPGLP